MRAGRTRQGAVGAETIRAYGAGNHFAEQAAATSHQRSNSFIRAGTIGAFLADDTMLHEPVCVKVLHASLADHPEASERFNREIVLGRRISHKGVCRLHDIYADGELFYENGEPYP